MAETITSKQAAGEKEQLVFRILQLAIEKSGSALDIKQATDDYNEARLMTEVESGHVDVMWAGAAPEKDKRLQAIRIPILKGLLGHRIFIIRKADQNKFSQIKTFEDLKQFSAGQGTFWGDTKVLKNAGLPTVTTIKYNNLFPMLEGGRFDYFPRAVHEPWNEVETHADLNLVVDKNIMLVYPYAMYFYVNKNNKKLHDIIYRGFETAIEDGSFDELFFNDPSIQDVLKKADLPNRRVFRVDNPFMHPDTPNDRKAFWLDVNSL
jgi:hypothetical protein